MQYDKDMNPLGKSNRHGGSSSNDPDTSDLNITVNSKLLDKSQGYMFSPGKEKESSGSNDNRDSKDAGVSRIISVNDLTMDRYTAHSGSELMSSTNMLPHFAALTSADKFIQNKIDTSSWTEEVSPNDIRNKTENDNKSAS